MSTLAELQAILEANPTEAEHWISYLDALIVEGQLDVARQILDLGRQHGLTGERVAQLQTRLDQSFVTASNASAKKIKRRIPVAELTNQLVNFLNHGLADAAMSVANTLTIEYPRNALGWKVVGTLLSKQGQHEEGIVALNKAATLTPSDYEIHSNLGIALRCVKRVELAINSLQRAIRLNPRHVDTYNNLGLALHDNGNLDKAIECYRQALKINPNFAEAYSNLGITLQDQGKLTEADEAYRRAIDANPQFVEAYINLGSVLVESEQSEDAIRTLMAALALDAQNADAYYNLGNAYQKTLQYDMAIASYKKAIELAPDYSQPYNNMGNVLKDVGDLEDAIASYRQAIKVDPGFYLAYSNLLFCVNYRPDLSSEDIYAYYQEYEQRFARSLYAKWQPHGNDRNPQRRLKIAYVSPSFHHHSCRYFLEPLLAHHDHTQFEIYAYAHLTRADEVTTRYQSYADHWIPTRGMSDAALAERIRADGIDILIDVSGHTGDNRLLTFARKPAPVSLHWLDFGYTTGLTAIDYYLTDVPTIPPGAEAYFAEQPWRLPTPAYAYRPAEGMGEVNALPALSKGHITFGTLTRAVRLNHKVIRSWTEILKAVPDAHLIINSGNFKSQEMQERIAEQFAAQGIGRERLEIGANSPPWDVLRQIDIGLDCYPHNSGTTLFEHLYMGNPFVTLANRPSVGRLGASILTGARHPEWIAETEAEYINKAVALAEDLPALSQIRSQLRQQLQHSPLMDEAGFTQAVEQAYRQMWQQWCASH